MLIKDGIFREVSDDRSQPPDPHLGPGLGSHRTSRSKMQPQMQNCTQTSSPESADGVTRAPGLHVPLGGACPGAAAGLPWVLI